MQCPSELGMIRDPVLVRFLFEERNYRPEELVGIVRRIKQWENLGVWRRKLWTRKAAIMLAGA